MGARLSKPANSQPEKPQLYAVATPHPTLQYIYPVYAAPMDVSNVAEKAPLERDLSKGRKSPLTWRNDKKRTKEGIQIVNDHGDLVSVAQPMVADAADGMEYGVNEDGTWYHFHVDSAGAVDYIRPGTTLPNAYGAEPMYTPQIDGGIGATGLTPSQSLAGVPYEESHYSYPASPYQGQQQIYQHPQPHHISQGQSEYSMGSSHHPQVYYSPHPRPYDPRSQDGFSHHDSHAYAYAHHPRARSVSPVHIRSMTPSNPKPRRATTPTPPRHSSKQPFYDPAPPMPQHITPIPSSRRTHTPFPRGKSLPTQSPRLNPDGGEDYIIQPRERDREQKTVAFASGYPSGRTSRNGRRPSADIRSGDEESTAISSIGQPEGSSSSASKSKRPTSPTPLSDYSNTGTRERTRDREYERERSYSKKADPARYYPSPPADASHSRRLDVHA